MILLWSLLILQIPGFFSEPEQVYHTQENSILVDGDILIPKSSLHRGKRQVTTKYAKWTDNTVVYKFDDNINALKRTLIQESMAYISSQTCIKFRHNNNARGNFVKFVSKNGCNSHVGMIGGGQEISIANGCEFIGTIVHEIMHTLGIFHTQSRYDRDDYVTVLIDPKDPERHNFNKETSGDTYISVPYEYGSIMHYSYSDPPSKIKMIAKQNEFLYTMGSHRVSMYDMKMVNIHYGCGCKRNLTCWNGGYTHPTSCSKCICPSGYGGLLCNQSPPGAVELTASSTWQSWTSVFERNTRKDEEVFFTTKTIILNGVPGRMTEVHIMTMNGFEERWGCKFNGVEIKTKREQDIVNPVICYKSTVGSYYRGKVTKMPILFYNRLYEKRVTFGFRYRIL